MKNSMADRFTQSVVGMAAAVSVCACSGGDLMKETGEKEAIATTVQELTNTNNSHYKPWDTNRVYRLYEGNKYCWIYEPGQADALRGHSPTDYEGVGTTTDYHFRNVTMPSFGRMYTGHCKYPTGCFRKRDQPHVYKVNASNDSFCWLTTGAKVAQYCGSGTNFLTIQRPLSEIHFEQTFWFDANDVLDTGARYRYDGPCP